MADDGPPHGWRIDGSLGSVETVLPGAEPVALPPSSRASLAAVDRAGHRLGVQFGAWTLVATGDSLTDSDIDTLLTRVALVETPDGFVQYQGSLPLWVVDGPQAHVDDSHLYLSLFLDDACGRGSEAMPPTVGGLSAGRMQQGSGLQGAEFCDHANRLRIWLLTSPAPTDDEIHLVQADVLSVGQTLAAIQRGEHP